jgi:flagellar basal body-associated protein FliL
MNYNVNATIASVLPPPPVDSGLATWAIVLIILASVLVLAIIVFFVIKSKKPSNA